MYIEIVGEPVPATRLAPTEAERREVERMTVRERLREEKYENLRARRRALGMDYGREVSAEA